MAKILVIIGPTATGKTDIALALAKKYNGALISCDSRQVYKGLDIGTGKLPGSDVKFLIENSTWYFDGIPVHMYDVAEPQKQFTVCEYITLANDATQKVIQQDKLPIIVGGTGLYLKALLYGLSNLNIPIDQDLREELTGLSVSELQKRLEQLSIKKYESLNNSDRNNSRRLIRAIELVSMYPYKETYSNPEGLAGKNSILKIGLTAPRPILNQRIDQRLLNRIDQGLIEEGRNLYQTRLSLQRMRELGLEYSALAEFLEGKIDKNEFILKLQTKIHQYAKRQQVWFKKEKEVNWFDITTPSYISKLEKLVDIWYYSSDDTQS